MGAKVDIQAAIKKILEEQRLSHVDFAKKTGKTRQNIGALLSKSSCFSKTIESMADCLGMTATRLVGLGEGVKVQEWVKCSDIPPKWSPEVIDYVVWNGAPSTAVLRPDNKTWVATVDDRILPNDEAKTSKVNVIVIKNVTHYMILAEGPYKNL